MSLKSLTEVTVHKLHFRHCNLNIPALNILYACRLLYLCFLALSDNVLFIKPKHVAMGHKKNTFI